MSDLPTMLLAPVSTIALHVPGMTDSTIARCCFRATTCTTAPGLNEQVNRRPVG